MLTYEETAGSMASKARKAAFISGARVRVAKDAGRTGVMTGTNAAEVIAMMESMIAQRCVDLAGKSVDTSSTFPRGILFYTGGVEAN